MMFRIRSEEEIAKLMLTDNCYKCMHMHYYESTPDRAISWCLHCLNKPKNSVCPKYKELLNYDLNVEYK